MFSPKKESCLREIRLDGAAAVALPQPRFGDVLAQIAEARKLRFRDKALPERLVILSLLGDTLFVVGALLFSFWVRFCTGLAQYGTSESVITFANYSGYIGFGGASFIFTLAWLGIYERSVLLRLRFVMHQVIKATLIWSAGFLAFSLVFKFSPPISRIYVGMATGIAFLVLMGWRWAFHRLLQRSSVAMSLRQRILFVGWNEESDRMTKVFATDATTAYDVVGCVSSARARYQRKPQVRVLGHVDNIADVIDQHAIDMVVLTDANCVKNEIVRLANTCEREMVQFKVIPSYFQILVSGLHLETVSGVPVLGVSRLPLDRFPNILLKRAVDIIGGIVGLICFAPVIAVFGAIVYWESPGAIFYRQRRLGRRGDEFEIIKIRSMRLDAEAGGKVGWTTKEDPRRLRIGAFMREWNIDELPQFWNVLKGDMSLVGPRPERPELIRNFKHEIPHYNARHNAKPGITGWAQVKGLRGDTDLTERINCDLWYLENWSPLLDLQIMFMTFTHRENAY